MSTLTKYIFFKYLKNFIIVLLSLEIFFTGIDFLQNFKSLPSSANLQLLYIFYNTIFTLTLTLPLSLVFALIITLITFVRNNEFVAFHSLGASKKMIILPVVYTALFFILSLIILQSTSLAYSYEQKRKIVNNEYFTNTKSDIFLKYDDYFVYFKKLLPLEKKAEDIHIYKIQNDDIVETIIAKEAYFQNNSWYALDAKVVKKPIKIDENSKLEVDYQESVSTLEGFLPKILNNVYEAKSEYSLADAISAYTLLEKQGINTRKVRAIIYNIAFVPFFIIPILFLIFIYTSLNSRFFHLGSFVASGVFGTLVIWGNFFLLYKITSSGVLMPEISLLIPLVLWVLIAYYIYRSKSLK
ncbi:putative permease YjgP/YjgQ family protein [Aliarcobacter thereius]|uniref:LptF/LptG family permease n=2 Tax=Aliarcobacter thereius TaxID=544718 RepID=A0A1C0B6K1_9BACT|nr:LptF/LptG family permease [Aliarcobacter thereius]OCL86747.1 putative permease YjgP/YjgQ family protein [Aliarcobacter thereius]OCL90949.1 putative permease YjgP/YjgQ family protein [Aliarcobacter thereius]OCL96222.1 putative permease YjgP/YjgQ family protein [Aliarcobacter thereius LMG 24486]OCL98916.1 putative permease YjgP/YjgQ family protein [Aliarcobacter thereius]QBF15813.1 putative lipooligosaccharide transport system, permease component LptG [Aliarcobacter thereius LMG 24486]